MRMRPDENPEAAWSDRRVAQLCGVVILVEFDGLAVGKAPGIRLRRRHDLSSAPIAPGAMPEHDHAVALGDVMLRHVFDHFPIALETGKILRQLVATLLLRQIVSTVDA